MSYQEIIEKDQRLVILRTLKDAQGYNANDSILHDVMDQYGHHLTRDQIRTHLAWLKEQGLVSIKLLGSTHVAELSFRGLDVANGRASVPGVKRPGPKG